MPLAAFPPVQAIPSTYFLPREMAPVPTTSQPRPRRRLNARSPPIPLCFTRHPALRAISRRPYPSPTNGVSSMGTNPATPQGNPDQTEIHTNSPSQTIRIHALEASVGTIVAAIALFLVLSPQMAHDLRVARAPVALLCFYVAIISAGSLVNRARHHFRTEPITVLPAWTPARHLFPLLAVISIIIVLIYLRISRDLSYTFLTHDFLGIGVVWLVIPAAIALLSFGYAFLSRCVPSTSSGSRPYLLLLLSPLLSSCVAITMPSRLWTTESFPLNAAYFVCVTLPLISVVRSATLIA